MCGNGPAAPRTAAFQENSMPPRSFRLATLREFNGLRAGHVQVGVRDVARCMQLFELLLARVVVPATERLQVANLPHAGVVAFVRHDVIDALRQGCPADGLAAYAERVGAPVLTGKPIPPGDVALLPRV